MSKSFVYSLVICLNVFREVRGQYETKLSASLYKKPAVLGRPFASREVGPVPDVVYVGMGLISRDKDGRPNSANGDTAKTQVCPHRRASLVALGSYHITHVNLYNNTLYHE